ncbi:MAG TPA: dihydrofolate reductase family protein [Polyangiales bacterium]|nr:dihydrofolate reductase family protein [Polyangiales bacterium]
MSRVRVFIACSLDGFIAGPNDELDWLSSGSGAAEDTFTPFLAQIGALLMGRRTYDVVLGFTSGWPYGETPVLVASSKPVVTQRASVRGIGGSIAELITRAKQAAGERDVYIDGGALIRSALDADLIDELIVTVIPIVLGAGLPLFAGVTRRHPLELTHHRHIGGGLIQLSYKPLDGASSKASL